MRGSPLSIICRLDDEYFKILQSSNGHEVEYDERLAHPVFISYIHSEVFEIKKILAGSAKFISVELELLTSKDKMNSPNLHCECQ